MRKEFWIYAPDGKIYHAGFCFIDFSINVIDIPDVIFLQVHKIHNHLYDVRYFLYEKRVICLTSYKTFKEMFFGVQKIIQEDLRCAIQN